MNSISTKSWPLDLLSCPITTLSRISPARWAHKAANIVTLLLVLSPVSSAQSTPSATNLNTDRQQPAPQLTQPPFERTLSENISSRFDSTVDRLTKESDRQYDRFWNGVGFLTKILLFIVTALGVLGAWLLPRTWKDFKEESRIRLKKIFDSEFEENVKKTAEEYKQKLKSMQLEIESITNFRKSRIVWLLNKDDTSVQQEIQYLYSQGFEKLQLLFLNETKEFQIGDCDLVIFSFEKTAQSLDHLKHLADLLKALERPTPLIVYTYNQGSPLRLAPAEDEVLKTYPWYLVANFPMTLISHVNALVKQMPRGATLG